MRTINKLCKFVTHLMPPWRLCVLLHFMRRQASHLELQLWTQPWLYLVKSKYCQRSVQRWSENEDQIETLGKKKKEKNQLLRGKESNLSGHITTAQWFEHIQSGRACLKSGFACFGIEPHRPIREFLQRWGSTNTSFCPTPITQTCFCRTWFQNQSSPESVQHHSVMLKT